MSTKFIHLRARRPVSISQTVAMAHGGATVAYRFEGDELVITGVICSPKDLYNRKEGRTKATERLLDSGLTFRLKYKPLFSEMLLDNMQASLSGFVNKVFAQKAAEQANTLLANAVVGIDALLEDVNNLDQQNLTKLVETVFVRTVSVQVANVLNERSAQARVEADARKKAAARLERQERHALRMKAAAERKAQYVTAEA